ncbi:hypothetical protein [Streptomyces sp. NPDC012508]|uniref:hypothetical protein n=1 Tax=Streptomyces sp. NPDC012508 TaxID=3364837 RepID=UPI00367569FC
MSQRSRGEGGATAVDGCGRAQAWALNCWGLLERDTGNVGDARSLFGQATNTGQRGIVLAASWNLAVLEVRAENLVEARRPLQQSADADGPPEQNADPLMYWSDVKCNAGNHERSRHLYQQILDFN